MLRAGIISQLQNQVDTLWDIIIIGGGATGLGIAHDASTRGYKTLLLEQSDFAKGTSSRSTKLVHGGVRYLAKGDLLLVMEALHERGLMLKNAAHLISNQDFVIPVYSAWDAFLYTVGLKFYDLLAGKLSMGKSYFISREKTISRLPLLKKKGLIGGVVYHDGQFDDARMAISIARSAYENGALLLNYFKVAGLNKSKEGKIDSVKAADIVSGKEYSLKTRLVINATGVFSDEVARFDNPNAKPALRPSQGVHIVLDRSFLQSNSAIMIPKTTDRRVLFAIPWYNEVVIGTTDTPVDALSLEPKALDSEIDFILNSASLYFTKPPVRSDILSIFAGLRPLAAEKGKLNSTREVSRRHKIIISPSGLFSVIGGKWTTYRRMAEETIDKAIKSGYLEKRNCLTKEFKIGKQAGNEENNRFSIYGDGSVEIEKLATENPAHGKLVNPALPYTRAEIMWICRNEMPLNIEDVLARRTRALFLNARASGEMAEEVAAIMAEEFNYDKYWQKEQIESYNELVKNYI